MGARSRPIFNPMNVTPDASDAEDAEDDDEMFDSMLDAGYQPEQRGPSKLHDFLMVALAPHFLYILCTLLRTLENTFRAISCYSCITNVQR